MKNVLKMESTGFSETWVTSYENIVSRRLPSELSPQGERFISINCVLTMFRWWCGLWDYKCSSRSPNTAVPRGRYAIAIAIFVSFL